MDNERDITEVKVFVRYKPKFAKQFGVEYEIINSPRFLFEGWKAHILKREDNYMYELIYSEVQLIKPKDSSGLLGHMALENINNTIERFTKIIRSIQWQQKAIYRQ